MIYEKDVLRVGRRTPESGDMHVHVWVNPDGKYGESDFLICADTNCSAVRYKKDGVDKVDKVANNIVALGFWADIDVTGDLPTLIVRKSSTRDENLKTRVKKWLRKLHHEI